ncbi:DUF4238 domain-containing protein [Neptunicella marina]|uniref:DUF4238 domain-containing protein n=1 Tax=Neptunicella marina TaxID=2125989 RepID=A0A8J6M1X7_9ALTE|nr:DUF4238 domain-containing protein [Neptunicella marina]MBC3765832.1 DUF4238 domain-containing protein [Neptunicella marina]
MIPGNAKKTQRGAKHHWWPKSLSQFWLNKSGKVNRISSNGEIISSNPKEFAHISNGHNFIYDSPNSWEGTIEPFFDNSDRNMRSIVKDLEEFRSWNSFEKRYMYATQSEEHQNIDLLRECILSLVVRSPFYRNRLNNLVIGFRGEIPKKESKMLITSNMGSAFRELTRNSVRCGRLAILFSDEAEFIYGDGVYNNISSSVYYLSNLQIVIPITPNIAVVWANPRSYMSQPLVQSLPIDRRTVLMINNAIQIYSKDYIFYRNEMPELIEPFTRNEHLTYSNNQNPLYKFVDHLIRYVP